MVHVPESSQPDDIISSINVKSGNNDLYIPRCICSKAVTIQWTVVESESQNPKKPDLIFSVEIVKGRNTYTITLSLKTNLCHFHMDISQRPMLHLRSSNKDL